MAEVAKPRPVNPKRPASNDPDPPGQLQKPNGSVAYVTSGGREGNNGMLRSDELFTCCYRLYQSSCNAAYGSFQQVEFPMPEPCLKFGEVAVWNSLAAPLL